MKTVEMRTETYGSISFIRDTTGGSDHDLWNIEDDDEYDRAADKFDEWLDTQEFEGFDIEE